MPTLTDRRTVAANATEANVLSGKSQEFLSEPAVVSLYAVADAVGVFASLIIGTEVEFEDQEISSAARFPISPDDFVAEGAGLEGERIVLKLRNSTGAGIVVRSRVQVDPVG